MEDSQKDIAFTDSVPETPQVTYTAESPQTGWQMSENPVAAQDLPDETGGLPEENRAMEQVMVSLDDYASERGITMISDRLSLSSYAERQGYRIKRKGGKVLVSTADAEAILAGWQASRPEPSGVSEASSVGSASEQGESAIDNLPAIRDWQSAPGFSALGAVTGWLFWLLLIQLFGAILVLPFQVIVLTVYVLVFYRSYFTPTPRITSSKAISFLNYAVSFNFTVLAILFGYLWNRNLKLSHDTKEPHMGVSYIIAPIFTCLLVGYLLWYARTTTPIVSNGDGTYTLAAPYSATETNGGASSSNNGAASSQRVAISPTKAMIAVPGGWDCFEISDFDPDTDGLVLYPSYASQDTLMVIIPWDFSEYFSGDKQDWARETLDIRTVNESVVLERNGMNMTSIDSETAELVEINGISYWKALTKGSYQGAPMTDMAYFCVVDGFMFEYHLSGLDESDQTIERLAADLDSIVESATYE